jgi:signal transduction histidine kinase/DNA-binding NarL/FixJ family response regulator/predicted RNA-binding protein with RPS1 domain
MTKPDWETIKEEYYIGRKVEGTVRKVWKFGALIELDDGISGVVRNKEMSWEEPVEDATIFLYEGERLHEGRRVKVAVWRLDFRKRQPIFSIRRAIYDPWEHQGDRYQVGRQVRGQVVHLAKKYALVEFDDHITARLPCDEIVPWNIDSIEKVIDKGDFIEARVKSKNEAARTISLSMKDRLEEIGEELARPEERESIWLPEPVEPEKPASGEEAAEPSQAILRRIERILVVDNVEVECLDLEAMLDDLGYETTDTRTDFAEAVQAAIEGVYDLILMDINGPGDEFAGIHAAQAIRQQRPDAPIVLVTGYDQPESSRKGQELGLAGMILKPVTLESLAGAIASLEGGGHAGWPVRLPESSQKAVEFVRDISQAAAIRRPLPQVLRDILEQIASVTEADKAAIFSMDPRTSWVEMPASIGISQGRFRYWRFKLPKSPVNDVIYRGEDIHENDISRFEGKYRNLRRMVEFNSCIGIPVRGAAGDLGYGLFLLHTKKDHFSEDDLVRAEAAATIIGRAVREHWVIKQVTADQRLTLLGSTITSVGHELRGRLGALEATVSLDRAWKQLKHDPAKLSEPKLVQKVDRDLRRLEIARRGMAELTDVLLGAVRQSQEAMTDVRICVQSAINMVAHEAAKAQVELVPELDWVPPVRGNRLELEQVFMNVLLNAIQQMPLARRRRGRVTIVTRYCPEDEQFPVKVRFIDTGPGIHSKHLEKIFEPMYTTKSKGTGMGLYICRELLALMGGQIQVEETAILVGTTFLVALCKAQTRR